MKIGIQLKHEEIQSFKAKKGKGRTRKEDVVATLRKFHKGCDCKLFARVANLSTTFDFFLFLFICFPISPHIIVSILHNFVIFIDWVAYNTQKNTLEPTFDLLKFWGGLLNQLPLSLSFSHFLSLFLTGQTSSEDDFSEDEWVRLLPP